jgi:competence protein ComEC
MLAGAIEPGRSKIKKFFELDDRFNRKLEYDDPDNPKNPSNWGSLAIRTFSPSEVSEDNLNNRSVVTTLSYGGIKAVLPGDNEDPSWGELVNMDGFLDATKDADVLLAPHHGRKNGYNVDIVNHINPRLTIVSDGRFCDSSARDRYREKSRGWTIYRGDGTSETRKCLTTGSYGAITVTFGPGSLHVKTQK